LSRELMEELYNELIEIEEKLKNMEKKIKSICKENDQW